MNLRDQINNASRGISSFVNSIKSSHSHDLLMAIFLYGILGLVVTGLIVSRELDMINSIEQRHYIGIEGLTWNLDINNKAMAIITAVMSILLIIYVFYMKQPMNGFAIYKKIFSGTLIILLFASGLLYLYSARGVAQNTFIKAHDSYHYLLGAKYYDELGYLGLYEATVIADAESSNPVFDKNDRIRNLENHQMISIEDALNRGVIWKENFSPERWKLFKEDIEFYKTVGRSNFKEILKDRGYNGTPFHSFFAGTLANILPTNYHNVTLLCLFDIIGLLLMMVLISWAFGWKAGAIFAIFFFTSFTDRHYYIGGSFIRYYWMITTAFGIAFLKKKHYALSGFFISTAAMLNVFPLLFLIGVGFKSLYQTILKIGMPLRYKRFILGAAIAVILLGSLSISHAEGIKNYRSFFSNMEIQTELATRSRIGLRYLFILPMEFTQEDTNYTYNQKADDLKKLKPFYNSIGWFLLALSIFLSKNRSDTEATLLTGFSAFFLLFNTVEYYYGMIGMLPMIWLRGTRRRFHLVFSLFFAGMFTTYFVFFFTNSLMISHNYLLTAFLLIFLIGSYYVLIIKDKQNKNHYKRKCSMYNWRNKYAELKNILKMRIDLKYRCTALMIISGIITLAIISLIFILTKINSSAEISSLTDEQEQHGVLVFGGDVMLGRRQHTATLQRGPEDALGKIPLLTQADLSVINLECVIAHGGVLGVDKGEQGPYYFRGRPEMLAILEAGSIDVVITANNHSGDYGTDALIEQLRYLEEMNMGYAGSGRTIKEASSPLYRMVGEVSVAIFGIDTTQKSFAATSKQPGNFYLDLDSPVKASALMKRRIKEARLKADLVFIAIHWGANYRDTPEFKKRIFGHALIDAGADAILGSSAHILQGVEVYKGRPIIHDAGNLLFDFSEDVESGLFALMLVPEGVKEIHFHPLESFEGFTRIPSLDRALEISSILSERSRALGTEFHLQDNGIAILELPPLQARNRAKEFTEAPFPDVSAAPLPLTTPPEDYTVFFNEIPAEARLDPIPFGPLELIGFEIEPEVITKREMLYVTTYWRLADGYTEAPPGLLLQIRAEPEGDGQRWSGAHEPCDWGWPSERFEAGIIYRDHFGIRPPSIIEISDGPLVITASVLTSERELINKRVKIGEIFVQLQ